MIVDGDGEDRYADDCKHYDAAAAAVVEAMLVVRLEAFDHFGAASFQA